MRPRKDHQQEQGLILLLGLGFLLLMTGLGARSLQGPAAPRPPAEGPSARQLAFEAAEAGLRAGEAWLKDPAHQALAANHDALEDPAAWDGRDPPPSGIAPPCASEASAAPPRFYVDPPHLARVGIGLPPVYRRLYPVTARGTFGAPAAREAQAAAVLQSVFEPGDAAPSPRSPAAETLRRFAHPDLGDGARNPAVVELCNGRVAAVFGNGSGSARGRAVLFVVDAATGGLIRSIDTGVGDPGRPNALSAPAVTDWPAGDLRATRAYAGDLHGNLWRFALPCPAGGTPGGLAAQRLFQATDPGGRPQAIQARPLLALSRRDPSRILVAFGTGHQGPNADGRGPAHSLYGIVDTAEPPPGAPVVRRELLRQSILAERHVHRGGASYEVRTLSAGRLDPAGHRGWYIDLDPRAREGVIDPAVRLRGAAGDRVRFITRTSDWNADHSITGGFLVDIDLATGGRADLDVFDLNGDEVLTDEDRLGGLPVSGIASSGRRAPAPGPARDPRLEYLYTKGGFGVWALGDGARSGRQSWRQLH